MIEVKGGSEQFIVGCSDDLTILWAPRNKGNWIGQNLTEAMVYEDWEPEPFVEGL